MRYREQRPRRELQPYVECLWSVWDPRRRAGRPSEHIVPDGCPELIVHLADPFARRLDGRWRRQPHAFLAGTLSRPWVLRAGPSLRTFGVRFRPGATTALLPIDMREATDREVGLASLVGAAAARDLVLRLARADRFSARVRTAELWLLDRLARSSARPGLVTRSVTHGITRPAVELVLRSRGSERIDAVAARLGVTPRRLERAFSRDLGIPPKLFARIVRLNAVLATLPKDDRGEGHRARIVDLALEAGYFDQPHLLRDFRAVAGRKPLADRDRDGEMARHFTAPERLLALLAGP